MLEPSLGYVHLPGISEKRGSSRQNLIEAKAITHWLGKHRERIESAFRQDGKAFGELVGIVTPFAAQARAIRHALNEVFGKEHGVTVGTVHAL